MRITGTRPVRIWLYNVFRQILNLPRSSGTVKSLPAESGDGLLPLERGGLLYVVIMGTPIHLGTPHENEPKKNYICVQEVGRLDRIFFAIWFLALIHPLSP